MAKAQKQGGKGKSSSPSDLGYWKRVSPEKQRAKRIARHVNRQMRKLRQQDRGFPNMKMALTNKAEPEGKISYGHKPHKLDSRRVILTETVKDIRSEIFPIEQIIVEGVIVQSCARESEAIAAIDNLGSRMGYQHIRQLPSGRRILVSSRASN